MKKYCLFLMAIVFCIGCTQLPEDAVGDSSTEEVKKEAVETQQAAPEVKPGENARPPRPKPTTIVPLEWNEDGILQLTEKPAVGTGFEIDISRLDLKNNKMLNQGLKMAFANPEIDEANQKMIFQIPPKILENEQVDLNKLNEMLKRRSERINKMVERAKNKAEGN